MADPTLEDVLKALRAADAAGNVEDARRLAAIADRMTREQPQERGQMMRQVNRGIVDAAGGLVDLINPFDQPHALNPFPNGTGSAREGLRSGMQAAGIEVAEGAPQNSWQAAQRGAGEAAAMIVPAGRTLQAMQAAPGMVGQVAQRLAPGLATPGAAGAEIAAGAASGAAMDATERAGGAPWLQAVAGMAAPVALGGAMAASAYTPTAAATRAIRRTVAPFTASGARDVARQRMQDLAGGPRRAEELAGRIQDETELGLTPAQQTEDPNMLGIERLAAEQDPRLRERLEQRATAAQASADAAFEPGAPPEAAQRFFEQRRREFNTRLSEAVNARQLAAQERAAAASPRMSEAQASQQTYDRVVQALDSARAEERDLWEAVPEEVIIRPSRSQMEAADMIRRAQQPWQRGNLPAHLQAFVDGGDQYTVRDAYDMYSSLREQARAAMAGANPQPRLARNANIVADAILEDLGAIGGETAYGRAINEARAFSSALHETFDRGAVGRILQRTLDGDQQLPPTQALGGTVGRGGQAGADAAQSILRPRGEVGPAAAPDARPFVEDYVRRMFTDAAQRPTGQGETTFSRGAAAKFVRDNGPLLEQFPELRQVVLDAARAGETAEAVQQRVSDVISNPRSARQQALEGFIGGTPEAAVASVYRSDNPARSARLLVQEASRDESGEALAALKGSFALELMQRASSGGQLSGRNLQAALRDPRVARVIGQVFSDQERVRLNQIARQLDIVQNGRAADVGSSLSGSPTSVMVETLARVAGANVGARTGGGNMGASLQAANIGSNRAVDIVRRLTMDKAAQLIADSIEDPQLFRALLMDPGSVRFERQAMPRLLPYLVGGATATVTE